ncbi:MAG TPA: glycosyltransferase [Terriglobales bacterium]|nr:glycosyltransferase [Terriglobales bacterium]
MGNGTKLEKRAPTELYGADYYAHHCGLPYDRSEPHWFQFFGKIADTIVQELRPNRVFDVGCAMGFLVEALRDRGVEAWGSDISGFAISRVRPDIRAYCRVGSATDLLDGNYDLITCIEVLEHLSEQEGVTAVRNMTSAADAVLFSSSPTDFAEATHSNVQPLLYWLKLFRDFGFAPDKKLDFSCVSPQAILLRKSSTRPSEDDLFEVALSRHIAVETAPLHAQINRSDRELQLLRQHVGNIEGSLGWRLSFAFRKRRNRYFPEGTTRRIWADRALRFVKFLLLEGIPKLKNRVRQSAAWQVATKVLLRRGRLFISTAAYRRWIELRESQFWPSKVIGEELKQFSYCPTLSIIMPVYNVRKDYLEKAINSVRDQVYGNWELCICDDASTQEHIRPYLETLKLQDPRIKVLFSEHRGGISAASNRALELASGDFVGFLDHDDELSSAALFEVVKLLQEHPEADVIYSDEDKLEPSGERSDPFFKPDWSPEYLLSCNYVCHFGVYRKKCVDEVGGFRSGFDGSQDYDLVLRIAERTHNIFRIPKILYHWRKAEGSTATTALAKNFSTDAGLKALREHMQRCGIGGSVLNDGQPNRYRVRPEIAEQPLVSIIIPTKDGVPVLKRCLQSIESKTTYPNYEILIIDNGSTKPETSRYFETLRHRVIRLVEPFNFSRLNNVGVQHANGSYLVFLNNDTEVISPEWINAMLELCSVKEVGIVGAKLYYPNRSIQHAGVVLGIKGVAGHSHKYFPGRNRGYFDSLVCIRNYSAVTAACMMVRRDVFDAVGGFDEELRVAFNDVDFCLRARQKGFRIVWTPYAELFHHESATRGRALDEKEVEFMKRRWGAALLHDPYYNPNLTLDHENFSIRL